MVSRLSRFVAGVMFTVMVAAPAAAQNGADQSRMVISRQLEAFLGDRFAEAYSYASQDIKRIYPTLDSFMGMVKSGYLPVLRPGNYAFGKGEPLADGRMLQEVLIHAPDGKDYTATYWMELQPDGSWKVDGVSLKGGAPGMT